MPPKKAKKTKKQLEEEKSKGFKYDLLINFHWKTRYLSFE